MLYFLKTLCAVSLCAAAAAVNHLPAVFTPPPMPPTASFEQSSVLSLQANPTLVGTAANIKAPLILSIAAQTPLDASISTTTSLAVAGGKWGAVLPPLVNGRYLLSLRSGTTTLATSTLAVGLKSLPALLAVPLPVYDVADGRLSRFSITAGAGGPVTIGRIGFFVASNNADVSELALYGFSDSSYTTSLLGSSTPLNSAPVDLDGQVASISPDEPLSIPTGQTYYFELDGTVTPGDTSYTVITTLLADHTQLSPTTLASSTGNFIWTPNTFGTSTELAADWLNGSMLSIPQNGIVEGRSGAPVPTPPTCTLNASTNVVSSQPVVVSWTSSDADYAVWNNSTRVGVSGTQTFASIPAPTTYVLTFYGKYGTVSCTAAFSSTASQVASGVATTSATTTQTGGGGGTQASSTSPIVDSLLASTTSGVAPLSVKFTTTVNTAKSCAALTYSLGYGDNSTSTISVSKNTCKQVVSTFTHTYLRAGTYTAALYRAGGTSTNELIQKITITSKVSFIDRAGAMLAGASAAIPMALHAVFMKTVYLLYGAISK